jgi:lipopolysaccharide/colanic/teichoic acid biosynthesis glycosyltransferase
MLKFSFDRIVSLAVIPLVALICIPCLIAIRLESKGNPLFIQTRVGKKQKPFKLIKLRTMKSNTASAGSHEVSTAQVTKIGHFLRRTKLDELPQIWNVLLGQMSFVGPRPCLPVQEELIHEREQRGVFQVRPGITGPAQLAGVDMSTPVELAKADAEYLTKQAFISDIRMIIATATGSGSGDALKAN